MVTSPMPRAGTLTIRSSDDSSFGFAMSLKYAMTSSHLAAIEELGAADHLVANVLLAQRFLDGPRLTVGSVQHGDLVCGKAGGDRVFDLARRRTALLLLRSAPRRA
jgi:hypothetical protein